MKFVAKKSGFLKVLGSEIDKSFKIGLIFTAILVVLAQIANFFINSNIKRHLEGAESNTQFLMDFYWQIEPLLHSKEIILVAIAIGLIVIFAGYVWFSEWLGNNKTAYMLLITPASKASIIISKFIVTYLFFLINYALIIASRYICIFMIKALPVNINVVNKIIAENFLLTESRVILPIMIFAAGGIALIFTFSLLNRWRIILGSIAGIIIAGIEVIIFCFIMYQGLSNEMFLADAIMKSMIYTVIVVGLNFVACNYLLKNKVHV